MVEGKGHEAPQSTAPQWAHDEWAGLVQRLSARRASFDRYTVHEEVGHGGMGRVLHVRDEDLHRDLAMKVMKADGSSLGSDPSTPTMMRARFVEEAQVAGQLDHPGIVPVHDVGLDKEGQFYFTMKLVRGRTFENVIALARAGSEGWSLTRGLNALLRVCEAMSYAHERGVLHRDLKPANVMIGNHGEVYVMDWGLARLVGRPDRPTPPRDDESGEVSSARTSGGSTAGSSLFLTQNDQVVGTPSFMSPEQAEGAGAHLTAQADVYSAGAMLYMALTGVGPYCKAGQRIDNRAVWVALQAGPPQPVAELAPKVAPELVSICEKAMARSLDKRYATMTELADDLRAYLEMRVVQAHRTGALVEFKKWVRRNKKTAAGFLVILLVISAAGFAVAASERARARESELRADVGESVSLLDSVDALGPIHPTSTGSYDFWLGSARRLIDTLPARTAEQAERAKLAVSVSDRSPDASATEKVRIARDMVADLQKFLKQVESAKASPDPEQEAERKSVIEVIRGEITWHRRKLAEVEATVDTDPVLRFADVELQREADAYHTLLHNLLGLERALPRVQREADLAAQLRTSTVDREEAAWAAAIASIADASQCPAYQGLRIAPQVGLVPLRRDQKSGLWEFWHVLTGEKPVANEQGDWIVSPNTGVVLVLIPGGDFQMGARSDDKRADGDEKLRKARLDPYFISKYEMTQGQWEILTDEQPSVAVVGKKFRSTPRTTRSNPVENVACATCEPVLRRVGLMLPTEMQWERAARGGTELPYITTAQFKDIHRTVNFNDLTAGRKAPPGEPDLDDGFVNHIRVDSYGPNPFGLYNVLGNVSEWCRDWYADADDEVTLREGDGEILVSASSLKRSERGGSFYSDPNDLRVSWRGGALSTERSGTLGLRPARPLDR